MAAHRFGPARKSRLTSAGPASIWGFGPVADPDTEVRRQCLDAAIALNDMRDDPKADMADVIADAALAEHYITDGQSVAIYCATGMAVMFRV